MTTAPNGTGRSYDGKDLPISTSFELNDPAWRRVVLVLPSDCVGRDLAIGIPWGGGALNGEYDGGAEEGRSSGLGFGTDWGFTTWCHRRSER